MPPGTCRRPPCPWGHTGHIFRETGGEQQFPEREHQNLRHNGYQIRLGARFNAGHHIVPFNGNGHEDKGESGNGHAHDHEADGGEASQHRNEQDKPGNDDGRVDGIDGADGKVIIQGAHVVFGHDQELQREDDAHAHGQHQEEDELAEGGFLPHFPEKLQGPAEGRFQVGLLFTGFRVVVFVNEAGW